jgi:DNA-binding NtrC family response regulator
LNTWKRATGGAAASLVALTRPRTVVFVQQAAQRHGRRVVGIAPAAMALLRAYDYPGNVRELRSVLEHAVIMSDSEEIQPRMRRRRRLTRAPRLE